MNVSNNELKAPRVSLPILCSETLLALRELEFKRNQALMGKIQPVVVGKQSQPFPGVLIYPRCVTEVPLTVALSSVLRPAGQI